MTNKNVIGINDHLIIKQREKVRKVSEKRLAQKTATNTHRKHELAKQTELTKRIRINMGIRQIRIALLRHAQQPNSLFLKLCTHPYFPLVFRLHPKRRYMENQAALTLKPHGTTPQLRSLAQALSTALPELRACFEIGVNLEQVWLSAAEQLIEHPLDGNPLAHVPAEQLYQFSVVEHPTLDTKPVFDELSVEQKAAFCRYGCTYFSWFLLINWFNKKALWLRSVLKISKAKSEINQ